MTWTPINLRDGHLAKLVDLEQTGLRFFNNDGTYEGSGGLGWTDACAPARCGA